MVYLKAEREQAIGDFQSSDLLDNTAKLARLAGEISALDRIHVTLRDYKKRAGEDVLAGHSGPAREMDP